MFRSLITGGNSFIGRHLVNALIKEDVDVSIVVRNQKNIPASWESAVKMYEGDITKKGFLKGTSDDVDVIFHLAAYVHKETISGEEKKQAHEVNVEGIKNLLESVGPSVKHVILCSSVSVYGNTEGVVIDETTQTKPITPYGRTKLESEEILKKWGKEKGIKTTSLRLPLVYGPGNKGNIHKLIEAIDQNHFVMIGKGADKRSMVYVGNVVDAALSVVDCDSADGQVYLVTDGIDYSIRELCETIARELNKKLPSFYIPLIIAKGLAIIGDIGGFIIRKSMLFNSQVLNKLTGSLLFSSRKIQEEIGFKPKYNLHNTMNETINWYRS